MIECSTITDRSKSTSIIIENRHDGRDEKDVDSTPSAQSSSIIESPRSSTTTILTTASSSFMTTVPASFLCPLTGKIMDDPVMDLCGHTYERGAILGHLRLFQRGRLVPANNDEHECGGCCPISHKPLSTRDLLPNHALGERIDKWRWEQQYHGLNVLAANDPYFAGLLVDVDLLGGGQQQQQQQSSKPRDSDVDVENQQSRTAPTTASEISNGNNTSNNNNSNDDSQSDDEGDDDEDAEHYRSRGNGRRNRVDWRYWNRRRRERRRQRQQYALLSQQQQQQQSAVNPRGMSVSSGGGTVVWNDPLAASSSTSKTPVGANHHNPHRPELRLLPQELNILTYLEERSSQERSRDRHRQRVRCASRCASLTAVLLLLAMAGIGLLWVVGGRWGSSLLPSGTPSSGAGSGGNGSTPQQERDQWPENGTSADEATDPPIHLVYERYTLATVGEDRVLV